MATKASAARYTSRLINSSVFRLSGPPKRSTEAYVCRRRWLVPFSVLGRFRPIYPCLLCGADEDRQVKSYKETLNYQGQYTHGIEPILDWQPGQTDRATDDVASESASGNQGSQAPAPPVVSDYTDRRHDRPTKVGQEQQPQVGDLFQLFRG